jgi:uncharacterized protein YlxW (UPF0749 family)
MDLNSLWSLGLSIVIGGAAFFIREKFDAVKQTEEEIKRVERLLNVTREEIARDYATNSEVQRVTDHIDQRFNRLEAKIDQLIQAKG